MTILAIEKAVFAPFGQGPLALAPQAFGVAFDVQAMPAKPEPRPEDLVRYVPVRGPLMNHADAKFMSYEVIAMIVGWQIESGAKAIILDFDSPGGLVAGAFETAKAIRRMCRAAGVRYVAYVGSQCSSAAYALASQADEIVAPEASTTGSIGVLDVLTETTKKAELEGISSVLLTSGKRKSDGNPLVAITPEAVASKQRHVDDLAEVFFELVAASRPLSVDAVRALEAGQYAGARAKAAGLIDRVLDLDSLKKELAAKVAAKDDQEAKPDKPALPAATQGTPLMASAARKALQAIVDDKDSSDDDKKEARAGLKAMGDEEKPKDDDKKDAKAEDKPADKKPDAKAEGDDDKKKDDDKKDEEEAKALAASDPVLAGLAELATLKAGAAPTEDAERKRLLATRPDFPVALASKLADAPLGVVRHYVKTIPQGQSPMAAAMAATRAAVKPTPAAAPSASAPAAGASEELSADEQEMNRKMGINAGKPMARVIGDTQAFSVCGHVQ